MLINLLFSLLPAPAHIKLFVLDEADEMLSRGFRDQIYSIFTFLPQAVQVRAWNISEVLID